MCIANYWENKEKYDKWILVNKKQKDMSNRLHKSIVVFVV